MAAYTEKHAHRSPCPGFPPGSLVHPHSPVTSLWGHKKKSLYFFIHPEYSQIPTTLSSGQYVSYHRTDVDIAFSLGYARFTDKGKTLAFACDMTQRYAHVDTTQSFH